VCSSDLTNFQLSTKEADRRVELSGQSPYFHPDAVNQKGLHVANHLYQNDLPDGLDMGPVVAIDCETMGLNPHRDRLCLIQMSGGDGNTHIVQVAKGQTEAPNLCAMLTNPDVLKLFHFGRFDIAAMFNAFGALAAPVFCTKIASRLIRTYTDRHGLKNLTQELCPQQHDNPPIQRRSVGYCCQQSYIGIEGFSLSAQDQPGRAVLKKARN